MAEYLCKFVENEQELEDALEVRRQVFVVEQGIPEGLVHDGNDSAAMHLVVKVGTIITATARVRLLGGGDARLERMAVLKNYRGAGMGKKITAFLVDDLKTRNVKKIVLHAQRAVSDFYTGCGFVETSLPFMEAGIEHVRMERKI